MDIVSKKLKHLVKHFDFKREELGEIEKMYRGDFFDPKDKAYLRLLDISKALCKEYSELNGKMGKNPSIFKILKFYFKKNHILDLLFPVHGTFSGVGENISVVIGLVDFLGCGFTNRAVEFSPYSLVECENYSIFATKIKVGSSEPIRNGDKIKLSRIRLEHDCWICAGVKIDGGVTIGTNSVLGAGACVTSDIPPFSLAIGNPAKVTKTIDKSCSLLQNLDTGMGKNAELKAVLKELGYGHLPKSYIQMYEGKPFNSTGLRLGFMFIYTHRLCSELNNKATSKKRREEILSILLPNHGDGLEVGDDFFVDMLGMTTVGSNVKIGSSVYMSGPVTIEDGAQIGDDTLMFSTGHSLLAKERRVGFSPKHLMYEYSVSKPIVVKQNANVGAHTVIVPGSVVTGQVPENSIFVKNKII